MTVAVLRMSGPPSSEISLFDCLYRKGTLLNLLGNCDLLASYDVRYGPNFGLDSDIAACRSRAINRHRAVVIFADDSVELIVSPTRTMSSI
jgi:hypothetical protein